LPLELIISRGIVAFSLLYSLPVDCLVAVTTWRRLRKRYIRYLYELHLLPHIDNSHRKNRVWEQDAYDIQPDSFTAFRKGSDDAADELGGLLSREERKENNGLTHRRQQSKTLIDEDDVICVEMMRRGGCLSAKESSFSQPSSSFRDEDQRGALSHSKTGDHRSSNDGFLKSKPSVTASTATSFGTTSFLSSLDPTRNSFINGSHPNEYLGSHPSPAAPTGRSETKVSFQSPSQQQQHELDYETGLSRVSEYSDDMSSARTIAWNRQTQMEQQSEIDEQSIGGMDRVGTYRDDDDEDDFENGHRHASQVWSLLLLSSLRCLSSLPPFAEDGSTP
jgi:hypothetical protein